MFGRDRLQNECQQSLTNVDLSSADCDPDPRKTLQMKVMSLEPRFGRSNVAADRGSRCAELSLEVADVDGARRRVEKCRQNLKLAVVAVEDARPCRGAESRQDRTAALRVSGDPDTHPAAAHHLEALWPEEGLDRGEVVPY